MTRRDQILKLIVEEFIKNAEPVGSKSLIEKYKLTCSSATIRNEMNALETEGLLEKTHTSSGRVPSSKGYRYYIDNLREKSINEEFKYQLQQLLDKKVKSVEEIITESCEILSQMTNLASVVLGPNAMEEKLVSVQLVPISNTSATCVFVTDKGYVENKTFVLSEKTKIADVESCIKLLNDRLKGTAIGSVVEKMQSLKPILQDYVIDHDVLYKIMLEAVMGFAKDRLKTYGKEELFSQPEFTNDAEKLKKLFGVLDDPIKLQKYLDDNKELSIHIAGENNDDDDNVSIIKAKVKLSDTNDGSIAIIGPKRMNYDEVVTNMEYLVKTIEKLYSNNGKDDDNGGSERDEEGSKEA